ncbi:MULTISPECIES: hypothetical protein [Nocardia]|uniref:hypothetical protein n=1 Tax=Nocardia TaxID=1817 RepID=UPI000D687059|nr:MULTISPECIES: hypothetical protein [Nocardia]
MNITIPPEDLNQALGKAILETLTEDARNTIITDAIAYLNAPNSRGYGGDKTTPLQDAFREGVRRLTDTLIEDVLKESERYQQVRSEIAGLIAQFPPVSSDPELKGKIVTLILDHVQEAQRVLERDRGY